MPNIFQSLIKNSKLFNFIRYIEDIKPVKLKVIKEKRKQLL